MANLLEDTRNNIDRINDEIVEKIDDRMEKVLKVIEYKEKNDIEIKDEDREEQVMEQFADKFEEKGMSRERGRQLGRLLIDTAIDLEREKLHQGK